VNLIAIAVVLAIAALAARRSISPAQPAPTWPSDDQGDNVWGMPQETDQTNNVFEDVMLSANPFNYLPADVPDADAQRNVRAFLDMLAVSEGTAGWGDNGYNVMFGHRLFVNYADHPRQYFTFTNSAGATLRTSAAGRYQFIVPTWDALRSKMGLPDFSPASQDAAAIELIRERGALRDVQAGRLAMAIDKCRTIWASLPGAGYSQPERSFPTLLAAYQSAGGSYFEA
jgi:lysozyme